jgi:hypothetical protein
MLPPDRPLKRHHRLRDQHGLRCRARKVGASVCHPNPLQKLLPKRPIGQTRLARYLPRGRALFWQEQGRAQVWGLWRQCLAAAAAVEAVVAFVAKALGLGVPQAGAPALVAAEAKVGRRAQLARVGLVQGPSRWAVAGLQAAG